MTKKNKSKKKVVGEDFIGNIFDNMDVNPIVSKVKKDSVLVSKGIIVDSCFVCEKEFKVNNNVWHHGGGGVYCSLNCVDDDKNSKGENPWYL